MKSRSNLLFKIIFLSFIVTGTIAAQKGAKATSTQPVVVTAVSPPFIPFILGETGEFEMDVEVRIDSGGNVVAAKLIRVTLFGDKSAEDVAMKWQFDKSDDTKERKAVIKFVYKIVKEEDPLLGLPVIFRFPYEIEVRHTIYKRPINLDPKSDTTTLH